MARVGVREAQAFVAQVGVGWAQAFVAQVKIRICMSMVRIGTDFVDCMSMPFGP